MRKILEKINTENEILTLPIILGEFSEPINCYFNVRKMVKKHSGEIIYGWRIHDEKYILEAERHSVWKDPNGNLIDITPNLSAQNSLFVVEDKGWVYDNIDQDNVRMNKTDNLIVDDFIKVCESIYSLYSIGKRKDEKSIKINSEVLTCIKGLEQFKAFQWQMITLNKTEKYVCFCGSLINYSDCHGKKLKELDKVVSGLISKYGIK